MKESVQIFSPIQSMLLRCGKHGLSVPVWFWLPRLISVFGYKFLTSTRFKTSMPIWFNAFNSLRILDTWEQHTKELHKTLFVFFSITWCNFYLNVYALVVFPIIKNKSRESCLELDHLSLALLVTSQFEVLATFKRRLFTVFALSAFHTKYDFLGGLCLKFNVE